MEVDSSSHYSSSDDDSSSGDDLETDIERLTEELEADDARVAAAAAKTLNRLAAGNNAASSAIVEAGAIDPLVALAANGSTAEAREWAAGALDYLAYSRHQAAIIEAGGTVPLVALLRNGSASGQDTAVQALCWLTHSDSEDALREAGAIPPLVVYLRTPAVREYLSGGWGEREEQRGFAAEALGALAHGNAANRAAIHAAGGVEALLALLRNGMAQGHAMWEHEAAGALANLAYDDPICTAIVEAGGVEALVAHATNDEADGQEEAARALRNLARSNRVAIKKLLVLRALVTRGRAETTSRTAPSIKWLLGAGSLALPNELIREILGYWRATRIHVS